MHKYSGGCIRNVENNHAISYSQKKLREEYVAAVRRNLRSQLNRIDMVNEDGSVENLGEKYDGKRPH